MNKKLIYTKRHNIDVIEKLTQVSIIYRMGVSDLQYLVGYTVEFFIASSGSIKLFVFNIQKESQVLIENSHQ